MHQWEELVQRIECKDDAIPAQMKCLIHSKFVINHVVTKKCSCGIQKPELNSSKNSLLVDAHEFCKELHELAKTGWLKSKLCSDADNNDDMFFQMRARFFTVL